MRPYEGLKLAMLFLVLVMVLVTTAFLNVQIGRRNAETADEVDAFKRAMQEEIEMRFRAEQQLAAKERVALKEELKGDAAEAKDIAKAALKQKPIVAVLVPAKSPIPVEVVNTPAPATPIPLNDPHGGLLKDLFGR